MMMWCMWTSLLLLLIITSLSLIHSDENATRQLNNRPRERINDGIASDPSETSTEQPVPSSDTVLLKPSNRGPTLAAITAYTWKNRNDWPDDMYELPIYQNTNRDSFDYWNALVDELLFSRVHVVLLHGRGCWDLDSDSSTRGTGDLCPRHLKRFVSAVDRAEARNVIRVAMWDDTGAYDKALQHLEDLPPGTKFDLSKEKNYKYVWDHNIKIWFDTLPPDLWYRLPNDDDDGRRPLIAFWTLSDKFFVNQEGNASKLLLFIQTQFRQRYGVPPAFLLQNSWFEKDSTITESLAVAEHAWFAPKYDIPSSIYSYTTYNDMTTGVVAPSFRNGKTKPGCEASCREVTRRDGYTLRQALQAGLEIDADFVLLEGWTDMAESAGFYRSLDWTYPNRYINIVRYYADATPETLRFQAEAADRFHTRDRKEEPNEYDVRMLNVKRLGDDTGWYVSFANSGEFVEYQQVRLGCGTYRFTARVATEEEGRYIQLDVDSLPSVSVPNTGGLDVYRLVHLGQVDLEEGFYDLRVTNMVSGGVLNIDWFFLKRISLECTS